MPKQLNPRIRVRIIQIRASKPDRPPTIDAILEQLSTEFEEDQLPSRGTVGSTVKVWDALNPEIRYRDMPFEWHQLERARVPWEASRWVLECQALYQTSQTKYAAALERQGESREQIAAMLVSTGHFSNRWATWTWRVHQARPDWETGRVLSIAGLYVYAEQSEDLLPSNPPIRLPGVQALMAHMPDLWTEERPKFGAVYELGITYGIIEDFPEFDELADGIDRWAELPRVLESESSGGIGRAYGLSWWMETWRTPLGRFLDEHIGEIEKILEGTDNAWTPETAEQRLVDNLART